jgi:hypothetical protein
MNWKAIRLGVLTVAMCIPGAYLNLGLAFNFAAGNNGIDFNQFYAAGQLAGTGHLYDWDRLRQLESAHGPPIPSGRLPVVSWVTRPLTWLPYRTARFVWLIAGILAVALAALLWPGVNRPLMFVALAWSQPLGFLLTLGQDTPFWLLFFAAGLYGLRRSKPVAAGAAFSLCLCKYHLALGLPIFLAAQRRWKTLAAGALAGGLLVAACFPIEGFGWPRQYLQVLTNPRFSITFERMPNLHGLASLLPFPTAWEIAAAVGIAGLLWRACRLNPDVAVGGTLAAAAGLVLGHHGYVNDCALLVPLAVLALPAPQLPLWLKLWAGLLLTPLPVTLFAGAHPLWGQLLVLGFVVASLLTRGWPTENVPKGPAAPQP